MELERNTVAAGESARVELTPEQIAQREAENGLRQYDRALEAIEKSIGAGEHFLLQPSFICELNRLAVEGVDPDPGQFRRKPINITNTSHRPPDAGDVERLVQAMCDYVNTSSGH